MVQLPEVGAGRMVLHTPAPAPTGLTNQQKSPESGNDMGTYRFPTSFCSRTTHRPTNYNVSIGRTM
jgi:hypothetical protein